MDISIHDELLAAEVRTHTRDDGGTFGVLTFELQPCVYGGSPNYVSKNTVKMFFEDAVLANRIQVDIAYRLKERADELAAAPVAEAAE